MTTDEYFRKRALKKVNYSEKVANEILKRSIPIYEQALRNVQGELDKLYSQLIDDSGLLNKNILTEKLYGLERKIALREFTAQLEKKGINISEVYGKDFLRKLTRLSILEEKVYWEIKSIRNSILSLQNKGYKNIIENTYRTTMEDLRGELQNGDSNLLLSSSPATISKDIVKEIAQSEWIGGNYKIRFEGNIESFARRTKEIIGGGLSVGWSLEKIQKSIRDEFQTSRYETARLVRTESAYFLGQADLASYVEDGVVDYRYLATLDRRTSKICRSLDGKVFKVKDAVVGKNYPPMHPNCRSGTIPVLETMVDPETGKPLGIPIEPKFVRSARDYVTGERYETTARNYKEYYEEQREINKSAMREHYTDMRPIEDINKYIRVIDPPKLTQKQRQRILDTPVYKRIGLSQEQYMDNNIIKPHEREFTEKFTDLGYKISWITKREKNPETRQVLPNNDFIWDRKEWELKKPLNRVNARISGLIREGAIRKKENFLIDLGGKTVQDKLWKQLSTYNTNNPQKQISKLLVFYRGTLMEILLK